VKVGVSEKERSDVEMHPQPERKPRGIRLQVSVNYAGVSKCPTQLSKALNIVTKSVPRCGIMPCGFVRRERYRLQAAGRGTRQSHPGEVRHGGSRALSVPTVPGKRGRADGSVEGLPSAPLPARVSA